MAKKRTYINLVGSSVAAKGRGSKKRRVLKAKSRRGASVGQKKSRAIARSTR